MSPDLRELAAAASDAAGGGWSSDSCYPFIGIEPAAWGVWSEHGPIIGGSSEEVAAYIAAAEPAVIVGLLDEVAALRRALEHEYERDDAERQPRTG